jgi:hypothetical protein
VLGHIATLQHLVHSCIHAPRPYWRDYADFLARLGPAFLAKSQLG